MKKHNSKLAYLVFNYLRPIPAGLFGPIAHIYWKAYSNKHLGVYEERKLKWDEIKGYQPLLEFFKTNYTYKYDLGLGLFDHDSSIYEWCMAYGDCDDAALYSMKKLNTFGYKAKRYGLMFTYNGKLALHFDTLYEKDGYFYLFNYGNPIKGTSTTDVFNNFCKQWTATNLKYSEVWY